MRLLLDTHALIWWLEGSRRMARHAVDAIESPDNDVMVSAVTGFEIATKVKTKKLVFRGDLVDVVERLRLDVLPVTLAHGLVAGSLPLHHRDPFDRLLIAQARVEGLTVVTRDETFATYGVPVLAA